MNRMKVWFSLIELIIGITIVTMVMISGFQALSMIGIGKIKIIENTKIQQEAYFATERLFELIKKWGKIDYEEYWNRYSYNPGSFSSGHFLQNSGFGNYGNRHYCLSWNGLPMWSGGCLTNFNVDSNSANPNIDYSWERQVYNQYKRQFIDYNGDADADIGNEDASPAWSESFKGDDDDIFLGMGPAAFPYSQALPELYLINNAGTERTFFRWKVGYDPFDPNYNIVTGTNPHCNFTVAQFPTGTGCLWTIQMLKLTWLDEWYDHGIYDGNAAGGFWDDDGEIDTWLIHKDFDPTYSTGRLATTTANWYWQNIFPDTIHVSNVAFYLFPHKDIEYSWKDPSAQIQVAPYLQMKMTLQPSAKEKRKIKGITPQIEIATTIHLSDLYFQP